MEITLDNLEKAICHFYSNGSSQNELNEWLTSAQSSRQAWVFSWQLLDRSKSVEVQYFGASTLRIKISRYWNEVPPDEYVILRERLSSMLISYASGPKLVLTQLCLALSSMILHSIPNLWASPLSDFINMLQQLSDSSQLLPQYLSLLLEILTVLPEEYQSMRFAHDRRIVIRGELLKAVKDVLPILREVICRSISRENPVSDEDETASKLGILCLSSWIQHGVGVDLEESIHLVEPLLAVAHNLNLSEFALDAVTHLVNHPEAHRYPNLLMGMLSQLLSLQDLLIRLRNEGDFEGASKIYTVLAAFGENHSRLLLDAIFECGPNKDRVLQLIKILLESTGTPGRYPVDERCSQLAFSFWYILQDDICSAEPEKHEVYSEVLGPAYLTLVDLLMTKSMITLNQSDWTSEDKETFRCYRQDIADTLAYCFKFLRSAMMERLLSHLSATVLKSNQEQDAWPPLEACLHALKAVAENVEPEENQYVPQILSLFSSIQYSGHPSVVNMALETLGAYAEWLSSHPVYLGHVLPVLLFGLSNPEAAPAATMALKDITRDCQKGIRSYSESLLQGCEQALLSGSLKASEKVRLMFILGKILSTLPLDMIVASLNRVVGPCVEELRSLGTVAKSAETKLLIITRLKMIATLCTTLDLRVSSEEPEGEDDTSRVPLTVHQQPVLLIAQQLLPFLQGVIDCWGSDNDINESVCLVVKHIISTLMDEAAAFLPDLASVIIHCHQLSPQTATLDVAKLLLLMFAQAQGEVNTLICAFLSEIISTTLKTCGLVVGVSVDGIPVVDVIRFADNTEVLASFLGLLAQLIRKNPHLLIGSAYPLTSLFYCGIVGLTRPESPTLKAAVQFLVQFITHSRENPEMVSIVQNQGHLLVPQLLSCIGGESPRNLVEHLADVLLALNKKYFDSLRRWLNTSLGRDNFPSPLVNSQQKDNFCRSILKERSNKRRVQDIVREFSLQCRGLQGTEYSTQMNSLM